MVNIPVKQSATPGPDCAYNQGQNSRGRFPRPGRPPVPRPPPESSAQLQTVAPCGPAPCERGLHVPPQGAWHLTHHAFQPRALLLGDAACLPACPPSTRFSYSCWRLHSVLLPRSRHLTAPRSPPGSALTLCCQCLSAHLSPLLDWETLKDGPRLIHLPGTAVQQQGRCPWKA